MRLRPHAKTHKTPLIAHTQLAAGAIGITCAKLGEAEVMAAAGVPEILVSTEIVGASKVARLISLSRHARISTVVDDEAATCAISDAARAAGLCIPTLIDLEARSCRRRAQGSFTLHSLTRRPALPVSRAESSPLRW